MADAMKNDTPIRIGFLLVEGYGGMGLLSAIDPLHIANQVTGRRLYEWTLITADGRPVPASSGVNVVPDAGIEDVGALPYLFVVASYGCETYRDKRVFAWLRHLARHGTTLGSFALGTYVLAHAGLLEDHRCTIHWQTQAAFSEDFPELEVTCRLFEVDRGRITCGGGSATFDTMLHLITEHHGADLAVTVAEQMIHPVPDSPDAQQRLPLTQRLRVAHPKLIRVVEQMEVNLEDPLSREALAASVGLSTRQVERLFTKYLGVSPARYYLELRLDRAHLLLRQTAMSILDVSIACGFVSASHFSKCYRDHFGHPPRVERFPQPRAAAS